MRGNDGKQKDARQDEGAGRAPCEDFQSGCDRDRRAELRKDCAVGEAAGAAEGQRMAAHYADRAGDHEPARRGHEPADDWKRDEADGAAGAQDAEATQQYPGEAGRQRHHDQGWGEQVDVAGSREALRHGGKQRRDDGRGR